MTGVIALLAFGLAAGGAVVFSVIVARRNRRADIEAAKRRHPSGKDLNNGR